jgi:hypothetical protein
MVRPGPAAQAQAHAGATPDPVDTRHRDALAATSRVIEGHVGLEDFAQRFELEELRRVLHPARQAGGGRWPADAGHLGQRRLRQPLGGAIRCGAEGQGGHPNARQSGQGARDEGERAAGITAV